MTILPFSWEWGVRLYSSLTPPYVRGASDDETSPGEVAEGGRDGTRWEGRRPRGTV